MPLMRRSVFVVVDNSKFSKVLFTLLFSKTGVPVVGSFVGGGFTLKLLIVSAIALTLLILLVVSS